MLLSTAIRATHERCEAISRIFGAAVRQEGGGGRTVLSCDAEKSDSEVGVNAAAETQELDPTSSGFRNVSADKMGRRTKTGKGLTRVPTAPPLGCQA
eukprot:2303768-Rhodomonas_salina.2